MNLYSESNGTSARRGSASRVSSASTPIFAASTTKAASVGSPMTDLVVADGGVGAQSTRPRARRRKSGTSPPPTPRIAPGLAVAGALDPVPVTARQHRGRRHRVHGQRAGLVAVDDRRPAQGLDVGQRLDHRLGLGQMPRARRQHRLHEGRQAGRDRRDRGRDAQQQEGGGRPVRGRCRRWRSPPRRARRPGRTPWSCRRAPAAAASASAWSPVTMSAIWPIWVA